MKFKVGQKVVVKKTRVVGKVVYINPDGQLAEVRTSKSFRWPQMYREKDLDEVKEERND